MNSLVWVEHEDGAVKDATLSTITAAQQLGNVDLLVAGLNVGAVAALAAAIPGIAKVHVADNAAYAYALPEAVAPLVTGMMAGYDSFFAPATSNGRSIAPRVAALLDVMQVSDILSVESGNTFTRAIYAGNAIVTVRSRDAKLVVTVRSTAFDRAAREGGSASIEAVQTLVKQEGSTFVRSELSKSERSELTSARIVVAGGRGLQSAENFKAILEPLADRLGAAVGASRAAVDAGWYPSNYQIGQTGKIVAPEAYLAIGISGAIQHLAGMKESKVIVAINKDEDAPIFKIADIGLVGDIFEVIPELTSKL
jgi:electron transfer flavoprotein alpha subunit